MGFYVKRLDSNNSFVVARTNHPDIVDGDTPIEAVVASINYAQKTLADWSRDKKLPASKQVIKEQKANLVKLGVLLSKTVRASK